MQLSKLLRKTRVKISHNNEAESKTKPWMTVTRGGYYRREARACLLSLHMGHCIVMGEALSVVVVVVVAQGGSQDWHIFTFQNVSSGEPPSPPPRAC